MFARRACKIKWLQKKDFNKKLCIWIIEMLRPLLKRGARARKWAPRALDKILHYLNSFQQKLNERVGMSAREKLRPPLWDLLRFIS